MDLIALAVVAALGFWLGRQSVQLDIFREYRRKGGMG